MCIRDSPGTTHSRDCSTSRTTEPGRCWPGHRVLPLSCMVPIPWCPELDGVLFEFGHIFGLRFLDGPFNVVGHAHKRDRHERRPGAVERAFEDRVARERLIEGVAHTAGIEQDLEVDRP